jgi:hypothetical protein
MNASDFLSAVRWKMRSGVFSREPLTLLRFEWKVGAVECDWLMRPPDVWDVDLPKHLSDENQTLQALRDGLSLRDIVFESFPAVIRAYLRMFRSDADHQLELVMEGNVSRDGDTFRRVASVAMRAKLCGFRFTMGQSALDSMTLASLSCS